MEIVNTVEELINFLSKYPKDKKVFTNHIGEKNIEDKKKLLLKDLSARLPYGVIVQYKGHNNILKNKLLTGSDLDCNIKYYKPYLRPLSSMTLEELKEYRRFRDNIRDDECKIHIANYEQIDWLNKKMFDYRGLIKKNLALDCTGLHIYD